MALFWGTPVYGNLHVRKRQRERERERERERDREREREREPHQLGLADSLKLWWSFYLCNVRLHSCGVDAAPRHSPLFHRIPRGDSPKHPVRIGAPTELLRGLKGYLSLTVSRGYQRLALRNPPPVGSYDSCEGLAPDWNLRWRS